jgi:pyrrolysine biosynthesis protein PylD
LFAADDRDFLALNVRDGVVVDNSRATAQGYVHALAAAAEMSAGGLADRKVLVLGLGPVGMNALQILQELGVQVWVYDIDSEKTKTCTETYPNLNIVDDIETVCRGIDYIIDATPAAGIITESMITKTTIIACPGVPHGLTPSARTQIGSRLIHDNLALGVAVMAVGSVIPVRE